MDAHRSTTMKPERRAALFKEATREFTALGFEQASLNRIIAEVGMSKSSFYHYFANKTELFQQIMLQTMAPFAEISDDFEPERLTRDTFWPAILGASSALTSVVQNLPDIYDVGRMFHRNLYDPNGICQGLMEAPLALIMRLLEHGKVIGVIRVDLPTSLLLDSVLALAMTVDRWALENYENLSVAELETFQGKIVDMFMRILAPEES